MPVDFNDIESTEPDYYKILKQIIDTPLDLLMMDLTFSAEIQKFGRTEVNIIYNIYIMLIYSIVLFFYFNIINLTT